MLDLVEVNRRANAELWRNTGVDGNWLQVELSQPTGNRQAIGSWLEVDLGHEVVSREVTIGGGHAGGHLGWVHVGLGDRTSVKLRVIWPDGKASRWWRVDANQFLQVARDRQAPVSWAP
jgi:hypothetical protein